MSRVESNDVVYEPGKCISCGICVQMALRAKEPLGLTFVGCGFDLRIGAPFQWRAGRRPQGSGGRVCQGLPDGRPGVPAKAYEPRPFIEIAEDAMRG